MFGIGGSKARVEVITTSTITAVGTTPQPLPVPAAATTAQLPLATDSKLSDLNSITNRVRLPASEQDEPYDIKLFRAEIDALKSLRTSEASVYVVKLIAYCESPLALILEWCEGGTLYSHVTNNPNIFWQKRLNLLTQITRGLFALHKYRWEPQDAKLIHRDLKPQNLLITSYGIKICDFGLSRYLKTDGAAATTSNAGSVNYMSPEQMEGGELTAACDIYAFGGLIYFMITGRHPWMGLTYAQVSAAVLNSSDRKESILSHPKLPPLSDDVRSGLPPGLYDLMTDCLRITPSERPTLQIVSNRSVSIEWLAIDAAMKAVYPKDDFDGVVSTISNSRDVKSIGYWMDPNDRCEWLVWCGTSGFEYRKVSNGDQPSRSVPVSDFFSTLRTFVVLSDGSILYYNADCGLSLLSAQGGKAERLCDRFNSVKHVMAVVVSGDQRAVALTANSLHQIPLSPAAPILIEASEVNAFCHCAFAAWSYPTLLVSTWDTGPYGGDILMYEFGSECPAEVKPISQFWPLVTDYAGPFRRAIKPSVKFRCALSVCVTPSRHVIAFANDMCSLFAIDTETEETVRIAGTGMVGTADGPSHAATFIPLPDLRPAIVLVASEKCVYVATGYGLRRISLNPKYFIAPPPNDAQH